MPITTKPFQSRAQAGWAFATGQPFARRWARQTGPYKRLPYKKRKKAFTLAQLEAFVSSAHYDSTTAAVIADGIPALKATGSPGEHIAPGITRIHGNLCNVHGRYGPCDKALSGKKPKGGARKPAKPKQTDAQRAAERTAKREQNAADVAKRMQDSDTGLSPSGTQAMRGLASGQQPDQATGDGLVTMGLAEQGADGSYRATPTGRAAMNAMAAGDYQRAVDTISRATDAATARQARRTTAATRQQAAATRRAQATANREQAKRQREERAKRPSKASAGGGKTPAKPGVEKPLKVRPGKRVPPSAGGSSGAPSGGGGATPKPKPPAPEKAPKPQIAPALTDAATALSVGADVTDAQIQQLVTNGLARLDKDGNPVLTAAGLRATMKAASPGDYLIVEDPAKSTTWHLQVKRNGKIDHGLMGSAWAALHGGFRGNTYQGPNKGAALAKLKKIYASEGMDIPAEKSSFRVFKDASGRYRWVAQSSTAFEDRDKEIVSTKALADDCMFADKTGVYGPLRWWHSPGLDLGDCDFNAMHGRVLIESGTFRSPSIAQKVAQAADSLEISLGFLHLPSEPDAAGVFHHIRRFERSLVPRGKASNRFTAFSVKEHSMANQFTPEKIAGLKAIGFNDEDIAGFSAQATVTEKTADGMLVASKDTALPDEETPPDLVINGVTYKAASPPKMAMGGGVSGGAADAEDTAEPPETPGETPDAEDLAEAPEEDAGGGLTLSPEDISAIGDAVAQALQSALGPLVSTMDLTNKIGSHMDEIKGMMGGYTTKKDSADAEKAEQIASLKAQQDMIQLKLDELLGLQPEVTPRATQAPASALNPFNPADNALLAAVKDQVPLDQQPFVNGFEDLKMKLFGA